MLCPLFLIEVTLAMQLAGLFPTFDLMHMYSLVHPTNSLYQILVGFHSTIFVFFVFFFGIFCICHLLICFMSIDLYALAIYWVMHFLEQLKKVSVICVSDTKGCCFNLYHGFF